MKRFADKTAVVTGGSAGIGRAIVTELGREGARVVYTSLPGDGEVTQADYEADGLDVCCLEGDMSDDAFRTHVVDAAGARFGGRIDCLVNNAFSFNATGMDSQLRDWDRVMHVGPIAFAMMTRDCAAHMARGSSIVNISSISARIAQPNRWTYNSAKGAVNQLTRCCAMDLGGRGIRVNTVSPGWTWTREVAKAAGGDREKYEPIWGRYSMLQRFAEPSEVARPVLFLLSDEASYITGSELCVDGGYGGMGPEGLGDLSNYARTN